MNWISVEDELPDVPDGVNCDVVAVNMDEYPEPYPFVVGFVSGRGKAGFECLKVTHWYPLPDKLPEV